MLILAAVLLLMLTPLLVQGLQWVWGLFRSLRFPYQRIAEGLVMAAGALAAWLLVLLARPAQAQTVILTGWICAPSGWLGASPAFCASGGLAQLTLRVDDVSWAYALAVITLVLAVVLTGVIRRRVETRRVLTRRVLTRHQTGWGDGSSHLLLGAFGLLAILAGNALTLLLTWSVLDVLELIILVTQVELAREEGAASLLGDVDVTTEADHVPKAAQSEIALPQAVERILKRSVMLACVAFATRLAGTGVLVWGLLVLSAAQPSGEVSAAHPAAWASLFPLLAAGLRLGVWPLQLPWRRGLSAVLVLIPAAASLALLPRVACTGFSLAGFGDGESPAFSVGDCPALPESMLPVLLTLAGLMALAGAGGFVVAADALTGRPFWLLGAGALALAAAVQGQAQASLSWGLGVILGGGLLSLYSVARPWLLPLAGLGGLALTGLPYTLLWAGTQVLQTGSVPPGPSLAFLLAHSLLLLGFTRHVFRQGRQTPGPVNEPGVWAWLIYPVGLALLVGVSWLLGWETRPTGEAVGWSAFAPVLAGVAATLALWLGAIWIARRWDSRPRIDRLTRVFTLRPLLDGLHAGLRGLYDSLGWIVAALSLALEGEGGMLWALLVVILLASWLMGG